MKNTYFLYYILLTLKMFRGQCYLGSVYEERGYLLGLDLWILTVENYDFVRVI